MVMPRHLLSHPVGFSPLIMNEYKNLGLQFTLDLFEITPKLDPTCTTFGLIYTCNCVEVREEADWMLCKCNTKKAIENRVSDLKGQFKACKLAAGAFSAMLHDAIKVIFANTDIEPFTVLQVQKLLAAVLSKVRHTMEKTLKSFGDTILPQLVNISESEGHLPHVDAPNKKWKPFANPKANHESVMYVIRTTSEGLFPALDALDALNGELELYIAHARLCGFPVGKYYKPEEMHPQGCH